MKCPRCSHDNPSETNYCGRCGMPMHLDQQETIAYDKDTLKYFMEGVSRGSVIADRYEVIEELGSGGMGSVFKVFDQKIHEKVALKIIRPEIAFDAKTIERFSNELKVARKVTHRNVCRLYDMGEHGKLHFITMEYVSGQDLKRMIRMTRQLSLGTAVAIARQVCEGLAESHRLGVVHRDLKPQNVMIDNDGGVKIMDFGIARSLYSKGVTVTGVLIGTPEYMSPEQAEAADVDHRTDIYALGVILFEMVTGEVPFTGETPLSIAIKHREEVPRDPCDLNAQVSDELCAVILKCLEKDKSKRYQSADELLKDLSRIEQGIPTVERVIPRAKKKTDISKEVTVTFRPKKFIVAAAVVIAVFAVIGILRRPWKKADTPTDGQENIATGSAVESPASRRGSKPTRERIPPAAKKVMPQINLPEGFEGVAVIPEQFESLAGFSKEFTDTKSEEYKEAMQVFRFLRFGAASLLKSLPEGSAQKYIENLNKIADSLNLEGTFKEEWIEILNGIKAWDELRKKGEEDKAQKEYSAAMKKLERFLGLLRSRDATDQARVYVKMTEEKAKPEKEATGESFLYEVASEIVKEADQAYKNKDYVRARAIYSVVGEVYTLSGGCKTDADCIKEVIRITQNRRTTADAKKPDRLADDNYKEALRLESIAARYHMNQDYRLAAEYNIKAAVLYEIVSQSPSTK